MLILCHHLRTHPGFYTTDSADITLRDIQVYHTQGMTVLFERSGNLLLERFNVRLHQPPHLLLTSGGRVTVRDNTIQVPGAAILVEGDTHYHREVLVQDNDLWCFDQRLVYARHLERLVFTGNRIHHTEAFPPLPGEPFTLDEVLMVEHDL